MAKYSLECGADGGTRLVASDRLSRDDFRQIAAALGCHPVRVRKTGLVAARQADRAERLETRWNGVETRNTAQAGDWIATSLDSSGMPLRDAHGNINSYVIRAEVFGELYEALEQQTPFGRQFRSKAEVRALALLGGFDLVAPWGERQQAASGFLIVNGEEVYGNAEATFKATYQEFPNC